MGDGGNDGITFVCVLLGWMLTMLNAHNISQTPKPLPRHQAAPAYSLPKGKVAIVAQNRINKQDKDTKNAKKDDNNNCKCKN